MYYNPCIFRLPPTGIGEGLNNGIKGSQYGHFLYWKYIFCQVEMYFHGGKPSPQTFHGEHPQKWPIAEYRTQMNPVQPVRVKRKKPRKEYRG